MAEATQTPAAPVPTKKELESAADRERIEMVPGNVRNPDGTLPWTTAKPGKKPKAKKVEAEKK